MRITDMYGAPLTTASRVAAPSRDAGAFRGSIAGWTGPQIHSDRAESRERNVMQQDTFNVWLNGLAAREFILGGRVTFEMVDNPTSDLMGGKVRWHVYLCPPQAAREIVFMLEYDPGYLSTLFGVNA